MAASSSAKDSDQLDKLLNLMMVENENVDNELEQQNEENICPSQSTQSDINDTICSFYSAVENISRQSSFINSADNTDDGDETISPTKPIDRLVDDSPNNLTEQLRKLDEQREMLKKRIAAVSGRRVLVPLDFDDNTKEVKSATTSDKKSVVHAGDTSSSEDEHDRNERLLLSTSGRNIKKQLKESEKRNNDIAAGLQLKHRASQAGKAVAAVASNKMTTTAGGGATIDVYDSTLTVRIRNPRVSSQTFATYCGGSMQKICLGSLRVGSAPIGEWVTIGVIVEKSAYKKSSNGNEYMLWKLSDLMNCEQKPVKLLLFGDCLKEHWKLTVGRAVALITPGYLESTDSDKSECVTLKVTKASHLLDIGQCSDFGTCKGVRNDGGSCRNYTNRSISEYCVYHLQSAAKKLAARRGAFQAPTSAPPRCGRQLKSIGNFAKTTTTTMRPLLSTKLRTNNETKSIEKCGSTSGDVTANETKKLNELLQAKSQTIGGRNLLKLNEKCGVSTIGDYKRTTLSSAKSFREFVSKQQQASTNVRVGASQVSSAYAAAVGRSVDRAKIRAAEILRKQGTMENVDANLSNKSKKRGNRKTPTSSENTSPTKATASAMKKTKLGDINLTDQQLKDLLARTSKSSHKHELDKAMQDSEEKYFGVMELKEKYETRMSEMMEVKDCKVISCKKCCYTWHSQSDYCKMEGHFVYRHTADKRFFKCGGCGSRTICYEKMPTKPCKQCNATNYERTSMKEERKVALLPNEKLMIRDDRR